MYASTAVQDQIGHNRRNQSLIHSTNNPASSSLPPSLPTPTQYPSSKPLRHSLKPILTPRQLFLKHVVSLPTLALRSAYRSNGRVGRSAEGTFHCFDRVTYTAPDTKSFAFISSESAIAASS